MYPILEYGVRLGRIITKQGDKVVRTKYFAENEEGQRVMVSPAVFRLLEQADGWHPFACEGVSRKRMREAEKKLVRCGIIRKSRYVREGVLKGVLTLIPIGEGIRKAKPFLARLNRSLPILMAAWFAIGVFSAYHVWNDPLRWSDELSLPLVVLLSLLSVLVHECAHLAAAVSYDCSVNEFGLLLFGPIPYGAFVMILEEPAERRQRVQLNLAGPEANLMLSGFFLFLSLIIPSSGISLWVASMVSLATGIINCLPAAGLDGHRALSGFLGVESLHEMARKAVFHRQTRKRLLSSGRAGCGCFCLLSGVLVCDALRVLLCSLNVLLMLYLATACFLM